MHFDHMQGANESRFCCSLIYQYLPANLMQEVHSCAFQFLRLHVAAFVKEGFTQVVPNLSFAQLCSLCVVAFSSRSAAEVRS
jgi:hypothetical protein